MEPLLSAVLISLAGLVLCAALAMHVVHQERMLLLLYVIQSLSVTGVLGALAWHDRLPGLFLASLITLLVKGIAAPTMLSRLLARHTLRPTASRYLNLPLTLLVLILLISFAHAAPLAPLAALARSAPRAPALLLGSFFVSLFLLINRRGVLSPVIGMLSLENSVIALGALLGVEQAVGLELGIAFDIILWVSIAAFMVSLIQRHFGTLDSTALRHLSE